jgi:class 3 adenylate cyclase
VRAVAELDAVGDGVVRGLGARLLVDLVEQVFEEHAVALEADGVHVRQVVGDGLQFRVLCLHAGLADPHCWIHDSLLVLYEALIKRR